MLDFFLFGLIPYRYVFCADSKLKVNFNTIPINKGGNELITKTFLGSDEQMAPQDVKIR